MSSPRVLSNKKNFTTVNDIWEAYYSENKFAITPDVQKALKYVPIYYQKKNLSAMAAAYSLWNSAEQRFEVFCPKNAVFRSANLHELGHIYFGHLKNSRKYIVMAEKLLKPYKNQIADFLDISRYNVIHDIINVCMDFEINSKFFVTKKEREELNASVQFYLLRRYNTSVINSKLKSFDPENLPKETIIFFPEDFGFPGKKSFLEYVQMMIDYCVHHKKPEIPQNGTGPSDNHSVYQSSNGEGDLTMSLPSNENPEDEEAPENKDIDSPINKEDNNNSDKESKMPSLEKSEEEEKSSENNEGTPTSEDDKGKEENKEDKPNNESNENGPHADESSLHDEDDKNLLPSIEDVDDDTFGKRFRANCDTEERKDRIKTEDCRQSGRKNPFYEINGETLSNEIDNSHDWMHRHEEEEEEIKNLKEKVDTASNATEINNFILKNALPSIDISSHNDILYNYNRGKTTDVFINKVRTRSTFRKPNVHIYTDVSGSMDAEYTKKVVKAVKAIGSRIDNRSSITFYNEWALNTEKFVTLSDEAINKSFVGGGTELARALKNYVRSSENNPANTLVVISDFCDDIPAIKKSFDNIKSTILCVEVGNYNNSNIADEFERYEITKAKLLKIVDRKYAA